MQGKPQSLGEGKPSNYELERDSRPLPSSRKEIVSAVEEILGLGGVQKLTIEIGSPITFSRFVPKAVKDPSEVSSEDPYEVMVSNEIEEYSPEREFNLYELLVRAFAMLTRKGFAPESMFVSKLAPIRKALGVEADWDMENLFGAKVYRSNQVPEGVLVLTGTKEETKYSLRLLIP